MKAPFAVSLELTEAQEPVQRLVALLTSMDSAPLEWTVAGFEGMGGGADQLSNASRTIHPSIRHAEFLDWVKQCYQIVELDASAFDTTGIRVMRVIVRDGNSLDLLGFGSPEEIVGLGPHRTEDCERFRWPGR